MMAKPSIQKFSAFAASVSAFKPSIHCFLATGAPQGPAKVLDNEVVESNEKSEHKSKVDEEDQQSSEVQTCPLKGWFYQIHVRSGHLSFDKIRVMARGGRGVMKASTLPLANVCHMPVWKSIQKGVENQIEESKGNMNCDCARTMHVNQSN
jgi:hypothetical protein